MTWLVLAAVAAWALAAYRHRRRIQAWLTALLDVQPAATADGPPGPPERPPLTMVPTVTVSDRCPDRAQTDVRTAPARTTTLDALDHLGLEPATVACLKALRDCPTPNNDDERAMADRLAAHIADVENDRGCVRVCKTSGPDLIYRERVAVELKRPRDGAFSTGEVDRAVGQLAKYGAAWPGPLVLVLFARSAPALDARLRDALVQPALRHRTGGAVVAVWKARDFFKVVAPPR